MPQPGIQFTTMMPWGLATTITSLEQLRQFNAQAFFETGGLPRRVGDTIRVRRPPRYEVVGRTITGAEVEQRMFIENMLYFAADVLFELQPFAVDASGIRINFPLVTPNDLEQFRANPSVIVEDIHAAMPGWASEAQSALVGDGTLDREVRIAIESLAAHLMIRYRRILGFYALPDPGNPAVGMIIRTRMPPLRVILEHDMRMQSNSAQFSLGVVASR